MLGKALVLQAPLLTGDGVVSLTELRGKVVLLDVWASWCKPCAGALDHYRALTKKHGVRGLVVVALGVDEEREAGRRFAQRWPDGITFAGDEGHSRVQALAVRQMPTTLLIGRDGHVVRVIGGFDPAKTAALQGLIEAALAAQ